MAVATKVVLYKKGQLNDHLKLHLGYRGFSAPPTLKKYISQKLEELDEWLPKSKIRILIEKSFLKEFYVITLHTRIRGKDFLVRSEDQCPFSGVKSSIKRFITQVSPATSALKEIHNHSSLGTNYIDIDQNFSRRA